MPAVRAPFMAARLTECIPALSADSIMEATRWHFPPAAGQVPLAAQASAAVPMLVGSPVGGSMAEVEEVTDENGARVTVKSIRGV